MMVSHRSRFGREVYLNAVPLFTNLSMTVTLNLCVYTGGTIVSANVGTPRRVMADIKRHSATYFGGTPTMYVYMVNDHDPARHDLSTLARAPPVARPCRAPSWRSSRRFRGVRVHAGLRRHRNLRTERDGADRRYPQAGRGRPAGRIVG